MRKIIFVRHGSYDETGNLDESGISKIRQTAIELREHYCDSIKIISSTAPRAIQSAEIIAKELGLPIERQDFLWIDGRRGDWSVSAERRGCELIKKQTDIATLIIVAHNITCHRVPSEIYRIATKKSKKFAEIELGEMLIVDFHKEVSF